MQGNDVRARAGAAFSETFQTEQEESCPKGLVKDEGEKKIKQQNRKTLRQFWQLDPCG